MDVVPGTTTQFSICIDFTLSKGNELGTHWARERSPDLVTEESLLYMD